MSAKQNTTEQTVQTIEKKLDLSNVYMKQLAQHSIDIEARSRRNNLIFYGLAECENANTYDLLQDFFESKLDLDLSTMFIQRIHRLGALYREGIRPATPRRPIIVALQDYQYTEYIMGQARMVRSTRFGMDRDYPKEISAARKNLWDLYKSENLIHA